MKETVAAAFAMVALGSVATLEAQVKSVGGQSLTTPVGVEAQVTPGHPGQARRATPPEFAGPGTVAAPAPSRTAAEAARALRSTDGIEQRLNEARQRQCNAEWERYHVAQAQLCGLDDRSPKGARGRSPRCDVDILGYEPSPACR